MKVLVISPHPDDETLGMGGTIALMREKGIEVHVAIITGHGEKKEHPIWPIDAWDTVIKENKKALKILGVSNTIYTNLPAVCIENIPRWEINNVFLELISNIKPDEIYVPFVNELHKDHESIFYAVNVATRPYLQTSKSIRRVLAYETLSETNLQYPTSNNHFNPNVFVDISKTIKKKLDAIQEYKSQLQNENLPRSIEGIKALARIRGNHIGCSAAEAFVLLGEYSRNY